MTGTRSLAAPRQPRGGAWRWALGVALVVASVLVSAYVGHHAVAGAHLAAAHVSPPDVPAPLIADVLDLPAPDTSAAFVLSIGQGNHVAVLAGPHAPVCPPVGDCLPPPPLDVFLLVDPLTGITIARTPLADTVRQPVTAAVDPVRQVAYVIAASAVEAFSTTSGARIGGYPLPSALVAGRSSGAGVTRDGTLVLTAERAGRQILLGLAGPTGTTRFTAEPGGARLDGPVLDSASGLAFELEARTNGEELVTYSTSDGTPRGAAPVPTGMRLGPLDDTRQSLVLFGANGTTWRLPVAALAGASPSGGDSVSAPLEAVPALRGAEALGWNQALGHTYLTDASGLRMLDDGSGRTLVALPMAVAWSPTVPLLVEPSAGVIVVPTDQGVVVVRDAPDPVAHIPTPATAVVLARAAITRLLPRDPQDPPFVTPDTFPPHAGTRDTAFWVYSATLYPPDPALGSACQATGHQAVPSADPHWQGPYCGSAEVQVMPVLSGRLGTYDVTFTVTWDKLFVHRRTWTYRVTPDGAVQLLRDAGDALP